MKISIFFCLAFLAAICIAVPHNRQKRASCTLTGSSLSSLSSIKSSCTSITIQNLNVPAGSTLDLTGLKSGTTVTFKGTIKFGYKTWAGPLISVSGTKIKIVGASGNKLEGQGASYWDRMGGNGGKTKPKFFKANKLIDSSITGLNIYNSPVHVFSINNCKNLVVDKVLIDDSKGASGGGHNTDGFDISDSQKITIQNSKVYNQDDCLAINSGTDIYFLNNICSGGHGISVGSVGGRSNNVVNNVQVKHCQILNSDNGIRVKTIYGATGSVNGVTFEDIKLSGIKKYGIVVRGDYTNGGMKGTATNGVPIKNLTVKSITGSVSSTAKKVFVLVKGASGWKWSGVSFSGGKAASDCSGIPSGSGAKC